MSGRYWNLAWVAALLAAGPRTHAAIFDSTAKVLVHSHCSVVAATHLQKRLDRYAGGGHSPITVVGMPGRGTGLISKDEAFVADESCQEDAKFCWLASLDENMALVKSLYPDRPVIFFAQSGVGNTVAITDSTDTVLIDHALSELDFLAGRIHEEGVDRVFLSTVQFNYSHSRFAEHNPAVVRAFNKRGGPDRMVDLVTPTLAGWPLTSGGDMIHPSDYGLEIMAHEWFKAMLEADGLSVPAWSDSMIQDAKERITELRSQVKLMTPRTGRYKVGDTLKVEWSMPACTGNQLLVVFSRRMDSLQSKPEEWKDKRSDFYQVVDTLMPSCGTTTANIPVTVGMFNAGGVIFKQPIRVILSISQGTYGAAYSDWTADEHAGGLDSMVTLYPGDEIDVTAPVYPDRFAEIMGYLPNAGLKKDVRSQPWPAPRVGTRRVYAIDGRRLRGGIPTGLFLDVGTDAPPRLRVRLGAE
ncbi:MAG: hypothetical protein ABI036_06365 [Fibrobacteria bacterium]